MARKDSGSKTTPEITAFYAQKSTFGLGGPIFEGSLDCSKSELFFATHARSPEMRKLLLFSAIFRKMAKTHLHLPFAKMSNRN